MTEDRFLIDLPTDGSPSDGCFTDTHHGTSMPLRGAVHSIMSDSDVEVGPDYLRTLAAGLAQPGAGVVTCLYRGAANGGFWSRLSAMAVHDHFLPGAILGLALGLARPCVGATIALSRETLARIGGFEAVANQLADDYAIGHRVLQAGLRIVVPAMFVTHSFEEKSLREVVLHELRWARTIFTVEPLGYVGSGVTHVLPLSLIGAALRGFDAWGLAAVLTALGCRLFLKFWFAREFELPKANYPLTLIRDLLSFAVFFACFWSARANWRGRDFIVRRDGTMAAAVGSTKIANGIMKIMGVLLPSVAFPSGGFDGGAGSRWGVLRRRRWAMTECIP